MVEVVALVANLRMLRKKKGISQKKLGEALGLSQQTINKYENHNVEPDIYMLMKVADFFEVSVDFLIGHTTKEDATAEETTLVSQYRLLTKSEQDSILAVIDNYMKLRK